MDGMYKKLRCDKKYENIITMKRIISLLITCILISSTQLSAMKRDNSHITSEQSQITSIIELGLINTLAPETITKIAAMCDPETRIHLSLTNQHFNFWVSEKNNKAIEYEEHFTFDEKDRFFYLFDGCINNNETLVRNVLNNFTPKNASDHFWLSHMRNYCKENGRKPAIIAHIERALGKKDA